MSGDQPTPWGAARLEHAGDLPAYGSPAWHALAEDDPARWFAAIAAAEAWQQTAPALADAVDLIAHLKQELTSPERVARHELDARTKAAADAAVDEAARRLLTRPAPAAPRPMVQTPDWPTVRLAEPPPPPTPLAMLQRLVDRPAPNG